ncbi:DUF1708-domain-containing protein [Acrodontium crateriforme]|uniref:DUF1708-domain-containing protein n=1 Tax=Acrodontium crateriforme TaxID=150365 RepID=A0AAQ3M7X7_9PEZI|nr:DUF1708-domain-containing protein [Acrodontium crateriforme]
MPMFSRFKSKSGHPSSKDKRQTDQTNGNLAVPRKPRFQSTWNSTFVVLEEVEELIHACTAEMKTRAEALNSPFLLLPFRPNTDTTPARTFIGNFFKANSEGLTQYTGTSLQQELRLTEAAVLCSIIKWCWARIPSGVVSWPAYDGFQTGEKESNMARHAFDTFIPISACTAARKNIIVDFFDLLASVAAHGKVNGMGGRKLSRLAGWWAFEHSEEGKGFESGYKTWAIAADACSHLFFAYLRSLSPETDPSLNVIERIPRSLQGLLASTEYPPERPTLLHTSTPRVVMLVDNVSPTPFALLRRAKDFQYRENDKVLREYSGYEDPIDALTEECKRVLYSVSSTNSRAAISSHDELVKSQESWSTFQNMGFSDLDKFANNEHDSVSPTRKGFNSLPASRSADLGRPTTPSWADFTSSGFDEGNQATSLILPPDKVLPPIGSRAHSSINSNKDKSLAPGELAAITVVELDDAFWWVWMTSLAPEEPAERKAVFGRCALVETRITKGTWLIFEEQLKSLSSDATDGMYVVQKKSLFGLSRRSRRGSRNSRHQKQELAPPPPAATLPTSPSRVSLAPEQQTRIKAAAAALTRRQSISLQSKERSRNGESKEPAQTHKKVNSAIINDASPAMKWASAYDQNALDYQTVEPPPRSAPKSAHSDTSSFAPTPLKTATDPTHLSPVVEDHDIPSLPPKDSPVEAHMPSTVLPTADLAPSPADVSPISAAAPESETVGIPLKHDVSAEDAGISPPAVPSSPEGKRATSAPLSPAKSIDRKPVPAPKEHPAHRQQDYEQSPIAPSSPNNDEYAAEAPNVPRGQNRSAAPQSPAAFAAQLAMNGQTSNLESRFHDAKLKKQNGGLKKLFGRNKDSPLAPPESGLGRRISLIRKKPPGSSHTVKSNMSSTSQTTVPEYPSEQVPQRVIPGRSNQAHEPTDDDEEEDADPRSEFARFDQGPMEDMPAMLPADSDSDFVPTPVAATPTPVEHASEPTHHLQPEEASHIAPSQAQHESEVETHEPEAELPVTAPAQTEVKVASPVPPRSPPVTSPESPKSVEHTRAVSETAQSEASSEVKPSQDRWTIIRENAARRAAAAQTSEEGQSGQSRQSLTKTDDGETSGEETIESRVARIKARVAELTGGMEGHMPARRNQ